MENKQPLSSGRYLDAYRSTLPIVTPTRTPTFPVDAREADLPETTSQLRPPDGAPNVLIVLIDDMGFGATSAFGGAV